MGLQHNLNDATLPLRSSRAGALQQMTSRIGQDELRLLMLAQDLCDAQLENIKARMNAGAAIEQGPLVLSPETFRVRERARVAVAIERRVLKAAGGRLAVIVASHQWRDLPKLLRDVAQALAASARMRKTKYEADASRELAKIVALFPAVATAQ